MDPKENREDRRAALRKKADDGLHGQGALVDATFDLIEALDQQTQSSAKLGNTLWWLNFWLLLFTIAFFFLALVEVWIALK